ncbi:MAG: helix-turn-helix domain-containing protein [Loktanella sp.]|nr:helix-turn-helix domain-containing protein [Loktanella sp.]
MSYPMQDAAWKVKGLSKGAKMVLLALADFHNGKTGQCNPGLSTLAEKCEASKSSIARHLIELEGKGRVTRRKTFTAEGKPTSTQYELHLSQDDVATSDTYQSQNETVAVPPSDSSCPTIGQIAVPPSDPNLESINQEKNHIGHPEADRLDFPFDEFWKVSPPGKRVQKARSRVEFAKAAQKVAPEILIERMAIYAAATAQDDRTYVKEPANWLRDEYWTKDVRQPKAKPGKGAATAQSTEAFHDRNDRELQAEAQQTPTQPPVAPVESAEKRAAAAHDSASEPEPAPAAPPEAKRPAPDPEAHAAFMRRMGWGHLSSLQRLYQPAADQPAYATGAPC